MSGRRMAATSRPERRKDPSDVRLDEMIEEAIVDAYGESEQTVGFYTLLEENLATPFKTKMLGVEVTVERVDMTDDEQIVAVCSEGARSSEFPSSICRYPVRHLKGPTGSEHFGVGPAGEGSGAPRQVCLRRGASACRRRSCGRHRAAEPRDRCWRSRRSKANCVSSLRVPPGRLPWPDVSRRDSLSCQLDSGRSLPVLRRERP